MGEILRPATLTAELQEIRSRLSRLESAERVGLNRIRYARATASAVPTVFAAWEQGPAGTTWVNDKGVTGTGYPTVTVETGTKVFVIANGVMANLCNTATYRSMDGYMLCGVDGSITGMGAIFKRIARNQNATGISFPMTVMGELSGLTPGTHTFSVWAFWSDDQPAAVNKPSMTDSSILVIPID